MNDNKQTSGKMPEELRRKVLKEAGIMFPENNYSDSVSRDDFTTGAEYCYSLLESSLNGQAGRWISVEERLPEAAGRFPVKRDTYKKSYYDVANFATAKIYYTGRVAGGIQWDAENVTHWLDDSLTPPVGAADKTQNT